MVKITLVSLTLLIASFSLPAFSKPLNCNLKETADTFLFYPEQLVYQSEQFAIFHNFKGRVVTQVDMKTNELIRTTYLGESYTPKYQILFGQCSNAVNTLEMWQLNQVPFDD
ncbi:hypothetical protein [Vibrio maerlii]|uniref:hypothetical protein n=1 Tax=Vibrio maerlii TaxID=2231648 RepID=UPI000E3CA214|nr:hypothetical protein [Vibrio maerlii]